MVVTQPDKPAGRGLASRTPAVADEARRLGLPLLQPSRPAGEEFMARLAQAAPRVAVTVAYGKILKQSVLDLPPEGFLNVHASLLPKYRGAGPVQWALINGERETGVSIMRTEAGLDTGPVCLQRATEIGRHERAPELFERLSLLGADAIVEALAKLEEDGLECRPQDDSLATAAPMLRKEDGDIDWSQPASQTYNRFRGVGSWPGARFDFRGRKVRVHEMRPAAVAGPAGEVLEMSGEGVTVGTGESAIELLELQPPGKGRMSARAWANGYGVRPRVPLA